jgi:hypothetical protein
VSKDKGKRIKEKGRKVMRIGFAHFVIPSEEPSDESRDLYYNQLGSL